MTGLEGWPGSMCEIAGLIGRDEALRLYEAYRGRRVYVPKEPKKHHRVARLIGLPATLRLSSRFAGLYLEMPSRLGDSPTIKARITADDGTTSEIASRIGCSARWVRHVRAGG